jgi:hypothetical protein
VNAKQYYFFSDEYFGQLKAQLGEALVFSCVLSPNDEVAAVGLFSKLGSVAQYLLGGTCPAHLKAAPSKLMFRESISYFKEAGAEWLNLGGGVGASEDSLFRFKRGFGTNEKPFHTLRIIHQPDEFRKLNESADIDIKTGFFPPYRSPRKQEFALA